MARAKRVVAAEVSDEREAHPTLLPVRTAAEVAAFEAMFRAHYAPICAFARRFVGSHAVAEELAQEVFGRVWARPGLVDAARNVRAYLLTATKRSALNHLQHEGLGARYEMEVQQAALVAGDGPMPTDVAEEAELEARVRAAVEALPPQTRAVWRLQREAGMSYAQVARELGLSVKTVERHMGRALHALRGRLAGYLIVAIAAVFSR
jgi:RNA polymerase sigma-70 factor (ECF subfamily)